MSKNTPIRCDLYSSLRPYTRVLVTLLIITGHISPGESAACTANLNLPYGTFSSPNYPNRYPNNLQCQWTIHYEGFHPGNNSFKLTLRDVDVEERTGCKFDYVDVFPDGSTKGPLKRLCGQYTELTFYLQSSTFVVQMVSDAFISGRGFNATYQIVPYQMEILCDSLLMTACLVDPDHKCIYYSWICDGVDDCTSGEDEKNCGVTCAASDFACKDYRSCIPGYQQCDGTKQCEDSSDEWDCFKLKPYPSGDVLLVYTPSTGNYLPVCSTNWMMPWNDQLCADMGYGSAVSSLTVPSSSVAEAQTGFLTVPSSDNASSKTSPSLLQAVNFNNVCSSTAVISLNCTFDACGSRSASVSLGLPQAYIIHGDNAQTGYWPWQAGLYRYGTFVCGGSIIERQWILTAAHCVVDEPDSTMYYVRVGSILMSATTGGAKKIYFTDMFMNPEFSSYTLANDVALLKLSEPLNYTDTIRPVCLDQPGQNKHFIECYATGWGTTSYTRIILPNILQQAKMAVLNDSVCRDDVSIGFAYDSSSMMCVGYRDGYITDCEGDSGGPLVCRDQTNIWSQVGVVSWGPNGCRGYTVHAKIQTLYGFVVATMNTYSTTDTYSTTNAYSTAANAYYTATTAYNATTNAYRTATARSPTPVTYNATTASYSQTTGVTAHPYPLLSNVSSFSNNPTSEMAAISEDIRSTISYTNPTSYEYMNSASSSDPGQTQSTNSSNMSATSTITTNPPDTYYPPIVGSYNRVVSNVIYTAVMVLLMYI